MLCVGRVQIAPTSGSLGWPGKRRKVDLGPKTLCDTGIPLIYPGVSFRGESTESVCHFEGTDACLAGM